jgi:hypothetical protein
VMMAFYPLEKQPHPQKKHTPNVDTFTHFFFFLFEVHY